MSTVTQASAPSTITERLRPLLPLKHQGHTSIFTSIGQSVLSALEALFSSKLRSFLTMLGIIIGVGAVIVVIAIGQGAKANVAAQLSRLGTNMVTIQPGSANFGGVQTGIGGRPTLTDKNVQAIAQQVPDIVALSPVVTGQAQVVFNGQNWNTRVQGVYPDYQTIQDYQTASGSFFTQADETNNVPVADLGQTVVQNLFPNTNPIGQRIRIRNVIFQVIGVLAPKGNNGFFNQDDIILIPYSTAQLRLFGTSNVNQIQVQVDKSSNIQPVINDITAVLRRAHHLPSWEANDFTVRNLQQILNTAQSATSTITTLLAAVAAISLLVGGIGIMNIMLVSVTERTREIGIRMAVGARSRDVLLQFLVEAVTLSVVGGIVGIFFGFVVAIGISHFAKWTTMIAPASVLLAFSFAALVGIFFGFYPARTASRLDPIEALRHE